MNSIEKLKQLILLLQEFDLPVSPILSYAIQEKINELSGQDEGESCDNIANVVEASPKEHYGDIVPEVLCSTNQNLDCDLVFRKLVDKSVLMQGFVIAKKNTPAFFSAMGKQMATGTNDYVCFNAGNQKFEVKMIYSKNQNGSKQLTAYYYDDLKKFFQRQFPESYRAIMEKRQSMVIKHGVSAKVDEGKEEYIELYKTNEPKTFRIVCVKYKGV